MRRVADFEHNHRVADLRFDVKALVADRETLQFLSAKRLPEQLGQIEAAIKIRADAAYTVADVGLFRAHFFSGDIICAA